MSGWRSHPRSVPAGSVRIGFAAVSPCSEPFHEICRKYSQSMLVKAKSSGLVALAAAAWLGSSWSGICGTPACEGRQAGGNAHLSEARSEATGRQARSARPWMPPGFQASSLQAQANMGEQAGLHSTASVRNAGNWLSRLARQRCRPLCAALLGSHPGLTQVTEGLAEGPCERPRVREQPAAQEHGVLPVCVCARGGRGVFQASRLIRWR